MKNQYPYINEKNFKKYMKLDENAYHFRGVEKIDQTSSSESIGAFESTLSMWMDDVIDGKYKTHFDVCSEDVQKEYNWDKFSEVTDILAHPDEYLDDSIDEAWNIMESCLDYYYNKHQNRYSPYSNYDPIGFPGKDLHSGPRIVAKDRANTTSYFGLFQTTTAGDFHPYILIYENSDVTNEPINLAGDGLLLHKSDIIGYTKIDDLGKIVKKLSKN